MLTAKQILDVTKRSHPIIIQNAKRVRVQFKKVEAGSDAYGEYRQVVAICKADSIPRQVTLKFYGRHDLGAKTWMSCTCEYFLYVCEVALEGKDSSDIIHSNGAAPSVTNPRFTPRTCKHCIAALLNGAQTLVPKVKAKPTRTPTKTTTKKPTQPEKSAPNRSGRSGRSGRMTK